MWLVELYAFHQGAELLDDAGPAHALGEDVPDTPTDDSAGPEPVALTPREMEVGRPVAEGLTNKQIAATLTIAQRTAEGHIEKLLCKLGFTSRTEIAVWIKAYDQSPSPDRRRQAP